jgi:hypothetical protein
MVARARVVTLEVVVVRSMRGVARSAGWRERLVLVLTGSQLVPDSD